MPKLNIRDFGFAIENDDIDLGNLKSKLQDLQYNIDSGKDGLVKAPLSKTIQQKIDRKVAYQESKKYVSKWKHFINQNRTSEHVDISDQLENIAPIQISTSLLTSGMKAKDGFEEKVFKSLQQAGLQNEKDASKMIYNEMTKTMSQDQIQERHAYLSKMRSMMFFHEQKLKYAAKIKSKNYHRIKNKQKLREALAVVGLNEEELGPDQEALLVELERAQKRISQKSKKSSRYLKDLIMGKVENASSEIQYMDELDEQEHLKRKILQADEIELESLQMENEQSCEPKSLFEKLALKKTNSFDFENDNEHFKGFSSDEETNPKVAKRQSSGIVQNNGRFSMKASSIKSTEMPIEEPSTEQPLNIGNNAFTECDSILNITGNEDKLTFDSQKDLIKRAFATDNVVIDFNEEKIKEVQDDIESSVQKPVFLPGWGSWSGNGAIETKGSKMFKERQTQEYNKQKQAALVKRKDFNLSNIIINDKAIAKTQSFSTEKIPFPFTSKEHYEQTMNVPLGKEWNTVSSFESSIQPKFFVKSGIVINPPSLPRRE